MTTEDLFGTVQGTEGRDERDFYPTPPKALEAFLEQNAVALDDVKRVLEPCCGRGTLVEVLRTKGYTVDGWDLYDYSHMQPPEKLGFGMDFLKVQPYGSPDIFDMVLTNPPFEIALSIILHSMKFAPLVVMLLRNSWLGGSKERTPFWDANPCDSIQTLWPRPSFVTGGDTDNSEFSWVVWDRNGNSELWPAHRVLTWR